MCLPLSVIERTKMKVQQGTVKSTKWAQFQGRRLRIIHTYSLLLLFKVWRTPGLGAHSPKNSMLARGRLDLSAVTIPGLHRVLVRSVPCTYYGVIPDWRPADQRGWANPQVSALYVCKFTFCLFPFGAGVVDSVPFLSRLGSLSRKKKRKKGTSG